MAEARYRIILDDLEVTMGLGVLPEEHAEPQRVALTVWLDCVYPDVPEDRIEAVINYDFLRAGIREIGGNRHIELQETLCEEVARLALADPRVARVRVRSMKLDIYPDAKVGCEIVRP